MKDEVSFGANRLGAVGATAFGAVWLGAGQSFNREPVVEEAKTMEGIPVGGAAGGLLVRDAFKRSLSPLAYEEFPSFFGQDAATLACSRY